MSISAAVNALTTFFGFKKINFDYPRWHTEEWSNWDLLDTILRGLGATSVKGAWANNTPYATGDRVIEANGTIFQAQVDHTSPPIPTTFVADRAANPSRWAPITLAIGDVAGLQAALDSKYSGQNVSAYAQTLLDDANQSQAKQTLGIAFGSSAGTFVQGDDIRFQQIKFTADGALQKGANLNDLVDKNAGRVALGLGPFATATSIQQSDIVGLLAALAGKLNGSGGVISGGLTVNGDLNTNRGDASGVIFLGNTGARYVFFDGSNYHMPNGELFVNGVQVAKNSYVNEFTSACRTVDIGLVGRDLSGGYVMPQGCVPRANVAGPQTDVRFPPPRDTYGWALQYFRPNYGWVTFG